ncbi:RNA-binding S4 domain-containing protein [Fastidiosipila sanguinis]|uniref:RQC P-site tRNA stabilizing factor n=1 Tax=Fastidiosipila sanguinis TaxID=236753 RepID=A0A2S0KPG1_9FIRM|nr:RNA-binding S4 domain-containing protein [Fastidiosipila sanguinis]AVM42913.1 hypothetical protein C5Q98_06690 [Fastidiosipila sanguinis]
MRLDKFLKVSRLFKRRTVAAEACDRGRVQVNSRPAKSGSKVKVGDEITINFNQRIITVKVLELKEHVTKDEASELYELISNEKVELDDLDELEEF